MTHLSRIKASIVLVLISGLFVVQNAYPAQEKFKKVVWIVFENTNYAAAMKQPDFLKLTQSGALLTNVQAETHPSQGNYVAMIAGSTLGVKNDAPVDLNFSHLGDLLEKAGLDWKIYAEDYPGNCFLGNVSGSYVRKHVPFLSFTSVTKNPSRCKKIESTANFMKDFSSGSTPEYSMYIPNLKSDGHDTGVDVAGKWMTSHFGSIFSNPQAQQETLFIVTFDESGGSQVNQIFTVLIGANVVAGSVNKQALSHAALLKLVEDQFNLGNMGRDDSKAPAITGIWK